jgi:hypothetical protein
MPERWERQVERLGTLTAPRSTSTRIAEGPRGAGMPPAPRRGQRIAATVVAFAVFGAAAVLAADAFRDQPSAVPAGPDAATTVIVRLGSSDEGPSASLEFGRRSVDPQVGSFCWSGTQHCVDAALVPFDAAAFVQVPSGTPVTLIPDEAVDHVVAWDTPGNDPQQVIETTGLVTPVDHVEGPPGRYVLAVDASWPMGDVTFYFPIEVVTSTFPTPSTEAPVLTAALQAPSDGSMPDLVISYQGQTQRFFAQDGRWPGVDAFPMPLQSLDTPLDRGTTIWIQSDADHIEGTLFIADADQRETGQSIPLDLTSGSGVLPDVGYFRLVLVGSWPRGEAGFSVGIRIGTPPNDWPPAPPRATVPNVVGLMQREAVATLTNAGFVSVSVASPAGATGGVVTDQVPAAGTETRTTTTIELTVATN